MDPSLSALGLKVAAPAVLAGYHALRHELSRSLDERGLIHGLASVDDLLDEAIAVLARQSDSLWQAVQNEAKRLISLPVLFDHPVPQRWIATDEAQRCVKLAARAAIRGDDDAPHAAGAVAHYALFLGDSEDSEAPDPPGAGEIYVAALDYLLASLRRALTPGERIVLGAIEGVRDQIANLAPHDVRDLIDARVREEIDTLRAQRFFRSADVRTKAAALVAQLIDGALSRAGPDTRAWALAWCTRILSFVDRDLAGSALASATTLGVGDTVELRIARAMVAAADDFEAGLTILDVQQSPLVATAAFQILRRGLGVEAGLARAADAGLTFDVLDSDGRCSLITAALEAGRWDEALVTVRALDPQDFEATPALLWITATLLIAAQLPEDLRSVILQDIPLHAAIFPLSDDQRSLEQRRLARSFFERVAARCDTLSLPREAEAAARYALWLGLRDPQLRAGALEELRVRIDTPGNELAYLPLALSFGLAVDRTLAEDAIRRQRARSAEATPELVSAAVALLLDMADDAPVEALDYLNRHRTWITAHLEPVGLVSIEVQLLHAAGRHEEAQSLLEQEAGRGLPEPVRSVLASTIKDAAAEPSIESLEAMYEDTRQTTTLLHLLRRYREEPYNPRFLELARQLLGDIANSRFAAECIGYLSEQGRDAEALELIEVLGAQVEAHPELALHAAWSHYRLGQLGEAERLLAICENGTDHPNVRGLRANLLISGGRWEGLDAFLEREWQRRGDRTPAELAMYANLAAQIGARRAVDFAREATGRAPDDPQVLMTAYQAATLAGVEDSIEDAGSWLLRAAAHSGPDGPIQSMDLSELMSEHPEWDKRVETAWREWAKGQLPLPALAAMLRRPWLELHLVPLVANLEEIAPRRRRAVALFSGRRRIGDDAPALGRTIAIEKTALVTLAAADALGDVLPAFDQLNVSHDVLSDLFEQSARIAFHQPSQIAFAHQLQAMIARKRLRMFAGQSPLDPALAAEIGHSLATLLSEAHARDDGQQLVVHPYPITRVGSLLRDPVPLERYAANLVSCTGVVDALERAGRLTAQDIARARGYLALHDRRWPEEPEIRPGATLYLSDLSIDYLRYIRLLDKIEAAGFTVVVSPSEIEQASALLMLEGLTDATGQIVTSLRTALADGIEAGRIVLGAAVNADGLDAYVGGLSSLIGSSAVLVSDDRCINRNSKFDGPTGSSRILSSADLVDLLSREGRICAERAEEIRARLRLAGAMLVDVDAASLVETIAQTSLGEEGLRETGELRAIRENHRLAQASGWFEPATDVNWLVENHRAFSTAIAAQWTDQIDDTLARARSLWLYERICSRDWVDTITEPRLESLAVNGPALDLSNLVGLAGTVDPSGRERYLKWLASLFEQLFEEEPREQARILAHFLGMVRGVASDFRRDQPHLTEKAALQLTIDTLPDFLQLALVRDADFRVAAGSTVEAVVSIGDAQFIRSGLFAAVHDIYRDPQRRRHLSDMAKRRWTLSTEGEADGWAIELRRADQGYRIKPMPGLHPDAETRTAIIDALLETLQLQPAALPQWRERLGREMLDAETAETLEHAIASLPAAKAALIAESVPHGEGAIDLLVPPDRAYFEALVGAGGAASFEELLSTVMPAHITGLRASHLDPDPWILLAGAHSKILGNERFGEHSTDQWRALLEWGRTADPMTKATLVELGLPHASQDPAIEAGLIALADQIEALNPEDEGGSIYLFSAIAIFVEGELSRLGILADWQPFRRRLASLAHASLLTRIVDGRIDNAHFSSFCLRERGWRFVLQTLVDMRLEPRWRPDFMAPDQLRNELFGRVVSAAFAYSEEKLPHALAHRLVGPTNSLKAMMKLPMAYWPGPLEGMIDLAQPPPQAVTEMLDQALAADELALDTIVMLVNIAATFRLPADLAERAAARVASLGPRLLGMFPEEALQAHLMALAHVAASHRLPALAEAVQLLARVRRSQQPTGIEVAEEMHLGLYLAAAHEEEAPWRESVARWIGELAHRYDDNQRAEALLGWAETLCEIDPVLRTRLGRAIASLRLALDR